MKSKKVKIGTKLYYTDSGDYVGTVIKILKYTCWYKDADGKIKKRWPLHFAEDMAK